MPETRTACPKDGLRDFPSPDSVIVQDGRPVAAGEIEARAVDAAARLSHAGCGRVALLTQRADTVAAALRAAAAADCGIALLRGETAGSPAMLADLGVTGLLDGDLNLTPLAAKAREREWGFRILLATSGTTGAPKFALHTWDSLLAGIRPPRTGQRPGRWLLAYHPASFAGLQVLLTALTSGGEFIAVSDPGAAPLAEAALTHRPTMASGTPTFWRSLLLALGDRAKDLPLEHITLGGEAADQATLDRLKSVFPGAGLSHIYASTEAGALFAVKDGRAGFPAGWLEQPVDGVGLRIRNGILEVKSPRRMQRYAGASGDRQSPLDKDGWLNTGDAVARSGERVMFLGRTDSVINVGGLKVSPEEVEAVLLEVGGVNEARVYGSPNPITGYLVSADIVTDHPGDRETIREALIRHARDRLDAHKVPRVIRFVDAIGLSQTGKKARRP